MALKTAINPKVEADLAEFVAGFYADPLGFVMGVFPWGQPDTPLAKRKGPTKWQTKLLKKLGEHIACNAMREAAEIDFEVWRSAVVSGHGVGKAQPTNLVLDTPSGRKAWGEIQPGDFLFGANGAPTRVTHRHEQGRKPVYLVSFDDGTSTLACAEHVWAVRGRQQRRKGEPWVERTTAELVAAGVTRANGPARARQWEIPQQGAVAYPSRNVGIDPYVLGLWLGDGGRNSARITSDDPGLPARIEARGYSISLGRKQNTEAKSIQVHGLAAPLRALGIFGKYSYEKSVPRVALENDAEFRAELLRGLLDTDGEAAQHGPIVFSSTSRELAEDVVWLARSLGGKARISPTVKKPFYRDASGQKAAGRDCWRAVLTMPDGFRAFHQERKQERVRPVQARYLARWITSIEAVGEEDCMCVTVEAADGLYLTNDFIVTHNSALVAWVILFLMCTRRDTRGVVTANTGNQLETKTWPELGKWHNMLICKHWFTWTATSYYFAAYDDDEKRKNYMVSAQTVSENNTEAFAGLHNEGRSVFVVFDEASGITSNVWEVVDGAFTDGEPFFMCFGNPTRPEGDFADCFGKNKDLYCYLDHVDSRDVEHTNKQALEDIIKKYGPDSDQARIRVYGQFPRQAFDGFISLGECHDATQREFVPDLWEGVIVAADVARYGDDDTVISVRQGRDFRNKRQIVLHGLDNVRVADAVQRVADEVRADAIVIESVGPGVGVIDILRDRGYRVIDVHPGSKGSRPQDFGNKRAEMWHDARDWIIGGGCLPEDPALISELTKIKYAIDKKTGVMWMESKEDMKGRGLKSPDRADSFVLTFGVKIARRDRSFSSRRNNADRGQTITEYDVANY